MSAPLPRVKVSIVGEEAAAGGNSVPQSTFLQPTEKPQEARPTAGVELLLKIEALARRVNSVQELIFLIANDSMRLTRARQVFVMELGARGKMKVSGVSAVSKFDRRSAQVKAIESLVARLAADAGLGKRREFDLQAYATAGDNEHSTYPFRNLVWVPLLTRKNKVFGGMLSARDTNWTQQDLLVLDRIGETFAHAWTALLGRPAEFKKRHTSILMAGVGTAVLLALAGFYPVPLAVLAPLEVSAINARVVAAPIDGVVDKILIDANTAVKAGTPVVQITDTAYRNEASVAKGELEKANAKLKRIRQAAVTDPTMLREIVEAKAEAEIAKAKLSYAQDMLSRTTVVAPADGVALYADKREWTGRPVRTGERILDIADPDNMEIKILIPVADSIAVQPGMRVRAFIDSDPMRPLAATVVNASYEARQREGGMLAFQVIARLDEQPPPDLRLGIRGTAQLIGSDVPLAFFLFRKPLTAIRQWMGL